MDDTTEDQPKPPRPPRGLASAGRKLWRTVVGVDEPRYVLRPDELALLERAARVADDLVVLDGEMRDAPALVEGSMGQLVAHPLLAERRHHAVLLSRLLGQLGLPDDEEPSQEDERLAATWRARRAARERWG